MGNSAWAVTTEKLTNSSTMIQEKTAKYRAEYEKLYTEVQNMKSAQWQGVASDAFNAKLEGYRGNFEQVEKLLTTFADGLATAAKNYENTENSVRDAAANLG